LNLGKARETYLNEPTFVWFVHCKQLSQFSQ